MWYNFVERGYFGLLSQHILVGWPCSAGGASIFFHSSPQQIPINSAAGPSQKVVRINFIRSKCFKLTCSSWLADSISAKLTDSQRGSKQDLPTTLPLSKVYFFLQKCIFSKVYSSKNSKRQQIIFACNFSNTRLSCFEKYKSTFLLHQILLDFTLCTKNTAWFRTVGDYLFHAWEIFSPLQRVG